MKNRWGLMITTSAILFLLMAAVASAASCEKTLYIDGVLIGSSIAPEGLEWSYNRVTIGAENDRWWLYNEYIGDMDDFAIYAGVMDPCSVAAHYAARTNYSTYETVVAGDAPLLWLKFDDASFAHEGIAANSGSVGYDAEYITTGSECSPITQVVGFHPDSNAINFPDTGVEPNGHCVDVWDGNGDFGEDTDGNVTIEVWVKFTDIGNPGEPENDYPRFWQHGGDDAGSYGIVANDSNELTVRGGDEDNVFAFPSDLNDGLWHHLVVTYESAYDPPNLPPTLSYPNEVAADNPVLWVRFDDETGVDSSGNGNWVEYGNIDLVKAGGIGTVALQDSATDGAGNYVVAVAKGPNTPPYEDWDHAYALVPNDITIEFWYKSIEQEGGAYTMFCQQIGTYEAEPNGPAFGLSDGQIRLFCGGTGHGDGIFYAGKYPYDQEWHHIVVTYDENYQDDPCSIHMQLYYDGGDLAGGVDSDLVEHTSTAPEIGANEGLGIELSHMVIGAANNRGYSYSIIPGYYDEFAVYDGVLSAERVLAHYAAWQVDDCNELWERGGPEDVTVGIADINKDCKISFADYALFALQWALCNDPAIGPPDCPPNW